MRTSKITLLLALLTSTISVALGAAEYAGANLVSSLKNASSVETGLFQGWQSMRSGENSELALYWGNPVALSSSASAATLANVVLAELGVESQFELIANNETPTRDYLIYRQLINELPVISGKLDLSLNKRGELSRIRIADYSSWPTSGAYRLSLFVAADYLSRNLDPANWQVIDSLSFACWYPDPATETLRTAYWLKITGTRPHQKYCGIVDAANGDLLLEWSGIAHDEINLHIEQPYWQPYEHSPEQIAPCPAQTIQINGEHYFTGQNGNVSAEAGNHAEVVSILAGAYVQVINDDDGEEATRNAQWNAPFGLQAWGWTTDDATRQELNLYYHTQFIHDWYKILDPEYDALDYPMPAVANYGSSYDNAFWDGFGTYYGGGSTYGDFAMFSDVIYHEYTHGVTDGIYPNGMLPYTGQPGAMNEAWSDYFACTINGDPLMADWLTGNAHSSFRDLSGHLRFPDNWVGEVHGDSPFISCPLWRMRNELGTQYTDSVAHFARYALTETFFDYFVAVLETDDIDGNLANGTPNDYVIYDAFGQSGIGPGVLPNLVLTDVVFDDPSGNGNGLAEAGETVSVSFTLYNDVELFPPLTTNAMLTASTDDNSFTLSPSNHAIGLIGPRYSLPIGPMGITISNDAEDHWGVISLSITADQLAEPVEFALEFTIGIPKVHVVTRDVTSSVDTYVTSALRSMDKIYQHKRLDTPTALDLATLPDTGMVIWLSGELNQSGILTGDRTTLGSFVNGGGHLVMSGQDILGGIAGTPFANDLLGVNIQGYTQLRMATSVALPFVEGESYLMTGSGGAANQDSMTILELLSTSQRVLRYGPAGTNTSAAVGPSGRTMVCGFGLEALADNSPIGNRSRVEFLDKVLMWAGHETSTSAEEFPQVLPQEFALTKAYPNPFNSSVRIEYQTGKFQSAELVIFDVLGREVHHANLMRGSGSYEWNPSFASGVYFAVLRSEQNVTLPQKLLLMR